MKKIGNILKNLLGTALASVVLILLGIIYFMVTVWIIRVGAHWAGFTAIAGDMAILTAGIITGSAIIGSAIQN